MRAPRGRRFWRGAQAVVLSLLSGGCSFDWDSVDPRLGTESSAGTTTQLGGAAGAGGAGAAAGGRAGAGGDAGQSAGGSAGTSSVAEASLYWVDSKLDRVLRAAPTAAAAPQTVVDLGERDAYFLRSLAVDTAGKKIYFSDSSASLIRRANLDGSEVQTLIDDLAQPMSLAIDKSGGKLYWADQGAKAKIQRANLDGSGVEDLVVDPVVQHPYGLVLDTVRGHVFFIDNDTDKLLRCDLDGANVVDLKVPDLARPIELALDLGAGKIYWSDLGDSGGPAPSIRRANLDGTNPESIITSKNFPSLTVPLGLDLDLARGYLYFVDGGSGGNGVIARSKLDGTDATPLLVGLPEARGLKVVPE